MENKTEHNLLWASQGLETTCGCSMKPASKTVFREQIEKKGLGFYDVSYGHTN